MDVHNHRYLSYIYDWWWWWLYARWAPGKKEFRRWLVTSHFYEAMEKLRRGY